MREAARTPPERLPKQPATIPPPTMAAPFGVPMALALLAGVSFCLAIPVPIFTATLVFVAAAGLVAWWGADRCRWLGPLLVGFALAGLHAGHALDSQLPASQERQEFEITGRIVELPVADARSTRFLFRVDSPSRRDSQTSGGDAPVIPASLQGRLLRLSWYDDFDGSPTGRDALRAGQRWRFEAKLRAPRGLRNPGGFDSEQYALSRRLTAVGHVRDPESATRLALASGLNAWREMMSDRIGHAVPGASSRYVRALALGDTRGLEDADWQALRAVGLTHLIAISGFHVGLVAGFFALLPVGLWWLLPGLGRRCPRPVAAAVAGLVGALVYAAVAGFALATVRTVLMIAVVAGVRILRRPMGAFDSLALAVIAVLLVDPLAILGAGFWLSFLGVAWLVWCLPKVGQRPARDFLSAQGVATLGLLPLTVILFGQASLAGPLANLVAVPWWSLVVVPLSLVGTALDGLHAGWGMWAWRAAAWCFDLTWPMLRALADSHLAMVWLPEPRWFALPLALFAAFWMLLPRGLPGKPLAALLWLPLLWPSLDPPRKGEAEVTVLDVGQGMAILVRTSRHALLYDTGPAIPEGFDAGDRVVVPALRALGVRRLDRLVVSHGDGDHAGGLAAVRREISIADAFGPEGIGIDGLTPCQAGTRWTWDGVDFRFLHPLRYFPYLGNDASCVLRIETAAGVALLTGDISDVVERELVRRDRSLVRADLVVAAHHGSASASDPMFVTATGARQVLFSTGHGNRFGHPRSEVVERWRHAGARASDTAEQGALTVQLRGDLVDLSSRRLSHPRLWDAAQRASRQEQR